MLVLILTIIITVQMHVVGIDVVAEEGGHPGLIRDGAGSARDVDGPGGGLQQRRARAQHLHLHPLVLEAPQVAQRLHVVC